MTDSGSPSQVCSSHKVCLASLPRSLILIWVAVSRHTLGIAVNGVFDRFPGVKVVIGHSKSFLFLQIEIDISR